MQSKFISAAFKKKIKLHNRLLYTMGEKKKLLLKSPRKVKQKILFNFSWR